MIQPKVQAGDRVAAFLLVCVLALAGAGPALAQASPGSLASTDAIHKMDALKWDHLSIQLTLSLGSPVAQIRQETLQHINFFATNYGDQVDFTRAVPRLLRIYDTDADEGYRIMALTALHAIGDGDAMAYLRESLKYETSSKVRQVTRAVLADYAQRATAL